MKIIEQRNTLNQNEKDKDEDEIKKRPHNMKQDMHRGYTPRLRPNQVMRSAISVHTHGVHETGELLVHVRIETETLRDLEIPNRGHTCALEVARTDDL